jgi:predicted extracellular nuclease
VDEYFGETQIKEVITVTILSSGNTLPTPTTISFPSSNTTTSKDGKIQPDLEAYEGTPFAISVIVQRNNNLTDFS